MLDASNGFLSRLPPALLEYLQEPLKDRSSNYHGRMHRFWIEADPVPLWIEENGDIIAGDPFMRIRKKLLIRNSDGELVDASSADEDNDSSPEAEFAFRATLMYDEIAIFFPEFNRLKEIAKVCAVSRRLHGIYGGVENTLESISMETCAVDFESRLQSIRQGMGDQWPINTSARLNQLVNDTLRANGTYRGDPRYAPNAVRDLEASYRSQLADAETKFYKDLAESISTQPTAEFKAYVQAVFNNNRVTAPSSVKMAIYEKTRAPILAIKRMFHKYHIQPRNSSNDQIGPPERTCGWVPAVSHHDEFHKSVYGGVNLTNGYIVASHSGSGSGGGSTGTFSGMRCNSDAAQRAVNNLNTAKPVADNVLMREYRTSRPLNDQFRDIHNLSTRGDTYHAAGKVMIRETLQNGNLQFIDPRTGYQQFRLHSRLNGKPGTYEVGITPGSGGSQVTHALFRQRRS
jgi:hypothetical protein